MELFDLTNLVALRIFFKTDAIILVDDANNFVSDKTDRRQLKFGKFLTKDQLYVPIKVSFLTKSTQTVAL